MKEQQFLKDFGGGSLSASLTQSLSPYLSSLVISYPPISSPIHLSVPGFAVLTLNLFNTNLCSHYNTCGKLAAFRELTTVSCEPVFLSGSEVKESSRIVSRFPA